MSRIHEALKKAQQERAAIRTSDAPAALQESVAAGTEWNGSAQSAVPDSPAQAVALEASPDAYLRFEELRAQCAHADWSPDPNVNVFFNASLSTNAAEQFRTLRSRLYQIGSAATFRTLLVTSSMPGEGKTFVTANLSQAIVRQPGRRVLMIDADLRCARLHVALGAPRSPGLSDYLRGQAGEMEIIQHGENENLCLIAGGTEVSDPAELLSNGRLKKLLDRVTPIFDFVILDSPPCLPVADATILANFCDGILLVVRAGTTPAEVAQRALQELQNRNVAGVVLNAVEKSHVYGEYYYQGYGYGSEAKEMPQ
jgi:protein-tyrosine kinase